MHLGTDNSVGPVQAVSRNISSAHRDALDASNVLHRVRPFPVRDIDRSCIPIGHARSKMAGALVEVHFRIRHFHLRAQLIDSFTGSIDQVFVLQSDVSKRRESSTGDSNKRRRVLKTDAPSRAEQVFAANAFLPVPSRQPSSVQELTLHG